MLYKKRNKKKKKSNNVRPRGSRIINASFPDTFSSLSFTFSEYTIIKVDSLVVALYIYSHIYRLPRTSRTELLEFCCVYAKFMSNI